MPQNAKQDARQLRAIGHRLKPVVTVAGNGLSEAVVAELERALTDHELIKVKLVAGSREERNALTGTICERCSAELVQSVGNVILILRRAAQPDPRLSNLIRPL